MVMLCCPCWLILSGPVVDSLRSRHLAKRREENHQSAAWASETLCSAVGARLRGQARVRWSRLGSNVNRLPQWPAVINVTHTHTLTGNPVQQWPVTVTDSLCCPDLHLSHEWHRFEWAARKFGNSSKHLYNALNKRVCRHINPTLWDLYVSTCMK